MLINKLFFNVSVHIWQGRQRDGRSEYPRQHAEPLSDTDRRQQLHRGRGHGLRTRLQEGRRPLARSTNREYIFIRNTITKTNTNFITL